jgi:small subunit ribosomal protein S9
MAVYQALGRRKRAVAKVRLTPGKGKAKWTINSKSPQEYFARDTLVRLFEYPFVITETEGKFNVVAKVLGGGTSGQAGALQLAVSRALVESDPALRGTLKKHGLLTRDPREKERMKYGLAKRRKRFQYSKR